MPPDCDGLAVNVTLSPEQMEALLTDRIGPGLTRTRTVSTHPAPVDQTNLYVPVTVSPVTVVLAEAGLANVAAAGLPVGISHVPVPTAASVAVALRQTVSSVPPSGAGDTVTTVESIAVQVPTV